MRSPVECPVCQSPNAKSLYLFKGADVVECHHCSTVYVPMPAPEFTSMYTEDYYANEGQSSGYHSYRAEFTSHLITFGKRLEDTEKLRDGRQGRLLDVGCALGHLGETARRRGWDVYVTDVSEYAVLEARSGFGLNGFISAPDKISVKPGRFDLITMYDVIEHLSHPLDLMKGVRQALASDGLVHITTPDISSLSAKLMGRHWYHLKPNEHLIYFTPSTLRLALETSGFEVVKIKPVSTYMRLNDIFLRLERYSRPVARFLAGLAGYFGLKDWRLKIYVGEMQAWARPARSGASPAEITKSQVAGQARALKAIKRSEKEKVEPVRDILDIVCCSNCRSEIQLFEESEAICTQCELSYEVVKGVINFSKYAKRGKQKLVGSS
jgi:SAM-dependent methyltransferase